MQYHFEHVFSIMFFFFSYELCISDQSQRVYWSNDKSSDDELGKIRKEKTEETEDEREGRRRRLFFFTSPMVSREQPYTTN